MTDNCFWKSILIMGLSVVLSAGTPPTPVRSISDLNSQDVPVTQHYFAEYPDICQTRGGVLWIVYSEIKDSVEQVVLKKIENMTVTDSIIISQPREGNFKPRIVCDRQNRLWICWSSRQGNIWDIKLRSLQSGKLSEEIELTHDSEVDLNPVLCCGKNDEIWVAWERQTEADFDIYAVNSTNWQKIQNISNAEGLDLRPQIICQRNGALWVVWDRQVNAGYQIIARQVLQNKWMAEQILSPNWGFNQAPMMQVDSRDNLTAVWQTDLLSTGQIAYNPWLVYCALLKTDWGKPTYSETIGDRRKTGEDQGLELPTPIFDRQDRLWIFSRASQSFNVQCLQGNQKSSLYRFDIGGWGGRGDQIRALLGQDGAIYSVRRDLKYIYLNRFEPERVEMADFPPVQSNYTNQGIRNTTKEEVGKSVLQLPDGYQIFFGDPHQHSLLSDGAGTIDACYTRSFKVLGYDFAALTDHEWFTSNRLTPSEWEWIKIMGRAISAKTGRTVIPGYEWTSARVPAGSGHKNVYHAVWDKPIFGLRTDAKKAPDLYAALTRSGGIAIPHHIGWSGTDWENYQPEIQPVFEIVSAHGANEYMGNEPIRHRGGLPGYFIQDGFKQGKQFGLIGGSDGHGLLWHHGVGVKESEWVCGLTAVIARENSLPAIIEAFKARRVYATSGKRILIDFRINEHWMGESISINTAPSISIKVIGTGKLAYVYLLRDCEPVLILGKDTDEGRGVNRLFVDQDAGKGSYYYYLRVVQEDGEMAWSSPIWVTIN